MRPSFSSSSATIVANDSTTANRRAKQIIGAPQGNFVWACRIACGEKGVPYDLVAVFPHTPEVDAIHPYGKIPAMRHGEVTLFESRAILYYIDHAFPGTPFQPRDPVGGAQVE